jgi:uncharacterized CHY-type Zn-finger protein
MTASQQGFELEELIQNALCSVEGLECLREQDIRSKFNDQSLNGVDHWIRHGSEHILIQDKWKGGATGQQEAAQFLSCAERIQARCAQEDTFYLVWACKSEPTAHSLSALKERNVTVVTCSVSIHALARLVVLEVCETFGLDPVTALVKIPSVRASRVATTAAIRQVTPAPAATPVVAYDDTDDGKRCKVQLEELMRQIQNTQFRKLNYALSNSMIPNVWDIYKSSFPQELSGWTDGTFKKIDFNAFARTMKNVSYPTKSKNFITHAFFFHCKVRFLSTDLFPVASQYNVLREQMLAKKSVWARKLPQLKCTADPMTDAEYRAQIVHCQDYWINAYGPDGKIVKRSSGLEYQFYQQYMM